MAAALPPSGPNTNGLPPKLSATGRSVLSRRREPGQAIAAAFAVVVHIGFFALIVFGVSWQVKVPAPLSAELWSALPTLPVAAKGAEPPPPEPPAPPPPEPVAKPVPPPKVVEPSKVDITLKAKKEREEKLQREKDEKAAAELKKREDQKRTDDKRRTDEEKSRKLEDAKRKAVDDKAKADAEARASAAQSARDAALRDYTGKIAALIRNRANIPDSVTGQPEIQVRVRLLTTGAVFEAQIARASGNRAYDDAVERAINGIRQWPVPDNPEILGRQRELLLNIKHER